jgi:hypothetical protein
MDLSETDLGTALQDLRRAAARVAESAAGSGKSEHVPEVLGQLGGTLQDLSAASYALGYVLVPRPRDAGPAWRFYANSPRGTYEQKALALSSLHELAAGIGASARRSRAAGHAVEPLVDGARR